MNNTMISIGKYIENNYTSFGLSAVSELQLIEHSKQALPDGAKRLIMLALRTMTDSELGVPIGYRIAGGLKGERFLTVIEFECKTRNPEPSKDFYWNKVRQMRDKVYEALAGTGRSGIVIPRYDWADPVNPVEAGEIWFEVNPKKNRPTEDPLEDPEDVNNKSIFLTYQVHWWRPVA